MKFIRYRHGGTVALGLLTADGQGVLPLGPLLGRDLVTMEQLFVTLQPQELPVLRQAMESGAGAIPLEQAELLAPIPRPLHDILCVGVNYKDHREETKADLPAQTGPSHAVYFGKRAIRLLGTGEVVESRFDLDEQLDYEVELAVIIGKQGRDIPPEQAEDYIFGYSVFNDLSSRRLQKQHAQWFRGKSLDTYAALGPCILHKSALPFPVETDVISRVNGQERQHSNTRLFLTDLPTILSELSAGMTLEPGDIIATGTPGGVGMGFQPPRFLQKGDVVECEIPPIGVLRNPIG